MSKRKKPDSEMGATSDRSGNAMMASPERERIAARAYELYLSRGGSDGRAVEDWLIAERELSKGGRTRRES